jgi:multicomponent Na+:H+ antiporter subunit C
MDLIMPVIVGVLYAGGVYLMLHRNFLKLVIGLVILGHATNLFLFTISRLTRGEPALIPEGMEQGEAAYADPVPQALILTAIVIGFGIQAFGIVLIKQAHQTLGTNDISDLDKTDQID